jgi:hypothetical protein
MKLRIDIDCTPEEARRFLGLPDVTPLNDALAGEMEQRLKAAMAAMDPQGLMEAWMPAGIDGLEQLQKMFFAAAGETGKDAKKGKKT